MKCNKFVKFVKHNECFKKSHRGVRYVSARTDGREKNIVKSGELQNYKIEERYFLPTRRKSDTRTGKLCANMNHKSGPKQVARTKPSMRKAPFVFM